jgi:Zn-dependent protease
MEVKKNKGLRIGGFRLTIDPLLPAVIVLIGWLLSERYFPAYTFGYIPEVNYILGGIASIMLTFSILFHELGHAFTAMASRLSIDRIHLFLFGGMAELKHRPITSWQEMAIAVSGPLASFLLAAIVWAVTAFIPPQHELSHLVLIFVVQINVLLGLFNLIPIFPLDGGRALRAFLWHIFDGFYKASMATLYISYALIGTLFLISIVDLLIVDSGYTLIILLLATYLVYTIYNGKKELLHKPEFVDLLYRIDEVNQLDSVIEQIDSTDTDYLIRSVVPVVEQNKIITAILGMHLRQAAQLREIEPRNLINDDLIKLSEPLRPGTYIDLGNPATFNRRIAFMADFVPVVHNQYFLGMCDSNEMRFWLNEKEFYDPNKPYIAEEVSKQHE